MYNAFGLSNVLTKSSRTCLAWWIVIVVHAEYWVCVVCRPAATGYDSTDHTTSRQKCVLKHIRRICVFRTKCTKIIAVLGFKTRSLWHNVSILLVPWCIAAHSTTILCLAHPCLPLCLVNPEVNMSNTHGASIREREFILRGLSVAVFKSEPFDARVTATSRLGEMTPQVLILQALPRLLQSGCILEAAHCLDQTFPSKWPILATKSLESQELYEIVNGENHRQFFLDAPEKMIGRSARII